ncbi:lipocalin [Gordonia iterans]|uniref:Lipocalin n=1 Tax=Gordonia iterans TaxID=1004901 RepID=A0A2S0KKP4_9ACTN|nr:lipocalin family protein [Gordonia iterans]AVM02258.1 lipocalin [Gordonia iterans]
MTIRSRAFRYFGAGILAALLTAVPAITPASAAPATPLQPVDKLDVERYLGTWWQQAAIPGFYSIRCARDTSARYGLIDETTISVDNTCISSTGARDGVRGRAKVVDPESRAQLSVSFPDVPFSVDPHDRPNYVVAWVASGNDPDGPYEYAIVGDPDRLSGFILTRDRVIPTSTLLALRSEVSRLGFHTCLFLTSPTTGGRSDYTPLCRVA